MLQLMSQQLICSIVLQRPKVFHNVGIVVSLEEDEHYSG